MNTKAVFSCCKINLWHCRRNDSRLYADVSGGSEVRYDFVDSKESKEIIKITNDNIDKIPDT